MLSLLQKSDQASGLPLPAWHPNFRRTDKLPDTKVVRTKFFVNFASLVVAASLVLYFAYREYNLSNFSQQMAEWQAQIDTNRKANDQALLLARKFGDEEKKVAELEGFLRSRLVLSELLVHLGETLPPDLTIDTVDIREAGVALSGFATGKAEEASGRISPYVELLKKDKYLGGIFSTVTQSRLDRDQATGQLTFDLFMPFKGVAKK